MRWNAAEREQLHETIRKGKGAAGYLLKARILPKPGVLEAGEGGSDNANIEAPETSSSMIYRVRKQLVEESLEAALKRKQRATPAIRGIFDGKKGEKEARPIALACSQPPEGHPRRTLRSLENKAVELDIVDRASDNTIGRVLKKHAQAWSRTAAGHPARSEPRVRSGDAERSRCLYAAARSQRCGGVPRRSHEATDQGNARTCLDEAGTTGPA